MNKPFFDAKLTIVLRKSDKERLKDIATENQHLYEDASHVARAAILKFINEYKAKGPSINYQ